MSFAWVWAFEIFANPHISEIKGLLWAKSECGIRANEPYQKNMPSILNMLFLNVYFAHQAIDEL